MVDAGIKHQEDVTGLQIDYHWNYDDWKRNVSS
jgi:hypothetical protein